MPIPEDVYKKYISWVEKDATGCWLWTGSKSSRGYGHLRYLGEWWLAHRFVYTYHNGQIPGGMVIRHTCDVRACVNPDHLIIGTHMDNINDQRERGRWNPGRHNG